MRLGHMEVKMQSPLPAGKSLKCLSLRYRLPDVEEDLETDSQVIDAQNIISILASHRKQK